MKTKGRNEERRVSGNLLVAISVTIVLAMMALLYLGYNVIRQPTDTANMSGSLFVSDTGQAKGGFEYAAMLHVKDGSGTLNLSLSAGLADALKQHSYSVTDFTVNGTSISMLLDGSQVRLAWTGNDTVWNGQFDNYYIASWGPSAPAGEIKGTISPDIFPGLVSHYYVELRLTAAVSS